MALVGPVAGAGGAAIADSVGAAAVGSVGAAAVGSVGAAAVGSVGAVAAGSVGAVAAGSVGAAAAGSVGGAAATAPDVDSSHGGEPPTRSAQIHAHLRAAILAGDHAPGDPLPSERQLSDELGASRHAVREALKRLQQAGLVTISQGGATRVRDWRRHGGLDLLLALAADGEAPPELGLVRATLEMRASVGADAARLCAVRADAACRAEVLARAEALAAAGDPVARTAEYDVLWDQIVEGSANLAYRLALNTLVAGQRVLSFDASLVGAEVADHDAVRALAQAIAGGDGEGARRAARALLDRSVAEV